MTLALFNIPAIAPQAEGADIDSKIVKELKKRFKHIVVFYDSDKAGYETAGKFASKYKLDIMHLPNNGPKDISDYYKRFGKQKTWKTLKKLIKESTRIRRSEDIPFV